MELNGAFTSCIMRSWPSSSINCAITFISCIINGIDKNEHDIGSQSSACKPTTNYDMSPIIIFLCLSIYLSIASLAPLLPSVNKPLLILLFFSYSSVILTLLWNRFFFLPFWRKFFKFFKFFK